MSAQAQAVPLNRKNAEHVHLPSVHIRTEDGSGFDYEEDLYVTGRGLRRKVERVIRLVIIEHGAASLIRETFDVLCPEELAQLQDDLPILMDEGNPAANKIMEECARRELARQMRISKAIEQACARCGCSESRACSGGCCWATEALCSRCV